MAELINAKVRSLRFYAAGGAAINLLRSYKTDHPKHEGLLANELYSYIDTSLANLDGVNQNDVFLLEGVDGSGKNRRSNAAAIHGKLPEILRDHAPADFNIVIFSASGGTGSVAGPLLLEALLKENRQTIAIVIGSHESTKSTTNTIGTLQGLEAAVQRLSRPIVVHYRENDRKRSYADNNVGPLFVMGTVSILVSGKNKHLDSADITNLFNYPVVTHHQPALAMLDVFASAPELEKHNKSIIALGVLQKSREELFPEVSTDYDTVGYLPESAQGYENSFYYAISTNGLKDVFTHLAEKRDLAERQQKVQHSTTSLLTNNVQADETGLIL